MSTSDRNVISIDSATNNLNNSTYRVKSDTKIITSMSNTVSNYAHTVIKRNGRKERVVYDKITQRVKKLSKGLQVEPEFVTQEVAKNMKNLMHVSEIDELAAQSCAFMVKMNVDYLTLAGRIMVSNLHKETPSCFSEAMEKVHAQSAEGFFDDHFMAMVRKHAKVLDAEIVHNNDYVFDYFSICTFIDSYLNSIKIPIPDTTPTSTTPTPTSTSTPTTSTSTPTTSTSTPTTSTSTPTTSTSTPTPTTTSTPTSTTPTETKSIPAAKKIYIKRVIERPQYLFMRVALWLHQDDISEALAAYRLFSERVYTHASPTLFNAGKKRAQGSSCFLLQIPEDSLDSIYDTLKQCAKISQHAGGIGLSIHKIRGKGSIIKSSGGPSDGIVPMLRVYNDTARYVNQGGKRKGAFAIYLEPWHADILDFLDLKKNRGAEASRSRDLHYGVWIPDLFMKRVQNDERWSLFSQDTAPNLCEVWGEKFEALYAQYEAEGRAVEVLPAREIWSRIIESQTETGEPYMLYKDACNRKSNQQNLGTIHGSNLCSEIVQYTSADEIAVCNLASICLPSMIDMRQAGGRGGGGGGGRGRGARAKTELEDEESKYVTFDHQKLFQTVQTAIKNLNRVIDLNFYPVAEAKRSNMRHRPVGLGIQGLADVFAILKYPYESEEARTLNREIFETMYFGALTASCEESKNYGPYETFQGSPISKGILQFDMWDKDRVKLSGRWNWDQLRADIKQHGIRNSLLISPMPTASTAQIMGFNESFEPFTGNLYVRRTKAGEFIVVNRHLANTLSSSGLWTPELVSQIVIHKGSIQNIQGIDQKVKDLFKTAFEIKTKCSLEMAADRGAFICQSQSLNIFAERPTYQLMNNIHLWGWKIGLKTGMYYLRSKAVHDAQQFSEEVQNVSSTTTSTTAAAAIPSSSSSSSFTNYNTNTNNSTNTAPLTTITTTILSSSSSSPSSLPSSSSSPSSSSLPSSSSSSQSSPNNNLPSSDDLAIHSDLGKVHVVRWKCNDDVCTSCSG